jgi:hypothetical protein
MGKVLIPKPPSPARPRPPPTPLAVDKSCVSSETYALKTPTAQAVEVAPEPANPVVLAVKRVQAVVAESNRRRAEAQRLRTEQESRDFDETLTRYNAAATEYLSILPKDHRIAMPNMHPQRKEFRREWLYTCLKDSAALWVGLVIFTALCLLDLSFFMTFIVVGTSGISVLIGAIMLAHSILKKRPLLSREFIPVECSKGNKAPWIILTPQTITYAQVFEAIPYDVWCDGWHNAAAAYLQQQIEAVSIEDMPAVLAALDDSFPSKESGHDHE